MADKYLWSGATGSANGTSWANAWTSITSVIWTSLAAGDTLWISGGESGLTYTGNTEVNNNASSEGQRVFIKTGAAHPTYAFGHDGFVTINGFVQLGGTGLGGNYLTIDGEKEGERNLRITGSPSHGIGCRYTDHRGITIRYVEIDENGNAFDEHGIKVAANAENWLIEHCFIHDNFQDCINGGGSATAGSLTARYNHLIGSDDCFQIGGGWDVYGNTIDTTQGNFAIGHPDGIQVSSGPFRCYANKFFGKGQQIFIEPKNTRTSLSDILIYNNLIYSNPKESGVAILMSSTSPDDGVDHTWNNIRILNNTICNINGVGVRLFHPSVSSVVFGPDGMIIANNIISNPTFLFAQDAPSGGGGTFVFADGDFELKNNIFNLTPGTVQFRGTSYTSAATLNAATDADDNQFADPLIVDETSDLRLQAGSPAIGAGLDFSAYFTTDYDGNTRTLPWDIGAYKYGAAVEDTTPPTPNPSTIASVTPDSTTQITVVATTAVDAVSSVVQYNHSIGGVFQGWQSSPTFVFTGLTPATLYSFRVKARDGSLNETTVSDESLETTLTGSETTSTSPLAFRSNAMLAMGGF